MTFHLLQICPVAPSNVSQFTDQISGNTLWVVIWMFGIATIVSIGAILVGKIFHAPHITKGGTIGLGAILATAVVLMGFSGMLNGILGSGCIA
jgi:hypothetical protein